MTAVASDRPPDGRTAIGRGMEQFHHPRPVCTGRGPTFRPTPQRERLTAGLTGRVVEFGAGDGVKLACYPPQVREIVLVEPDPFLRAAAEGVAGGVPAEVSIVGGHPAKAPMEDASCDAVVHALSLCCCASLERTLAEARRILRPGGRLRFYEHVRSANPVVAMTESLVGPLWARASGGCRPGRDPVAAIQAAGFALEHLDRFTFQHVSHVLGAAVLTPERP
ncbi:class I SAM-dependent methyltransferase [Nonomuraea sp. NPDC050790]|uniref:class I SAM-dependent methyltransferase n=1 Tax=Nonomuraea sp. NPDC050790 TaxID=3364371 RepID=UPI00378E7B31